MINKLLCSLVFVLLSFQAFAFDSVSWQKLNENLRLSLDLSVRGQYHFRTNQLSNINTIGIDMHKVFSGENGDIGTLIFQGYLTKLVNVKPFPAIYNRKDDLKFVCRICNFNLNILDKNLLNVRIGHYELPFGLEYNIDTNGTFRQFSNGRTLGGKLDWGVTANGKTTWGGYEISLSRGSGVDWTDNYSTYIVSGRVERSLSYDSFIGLSFYQGHLRAAKSDGYFDRTRIGLDASTPLGPFTFLTEFSVGKDDGKEIISALFEIDVHNPNEKLLAYFQLATLSHHLDHQDWDSMIQSFLGLKFTPDNHWTISAQWRQDLDVFDNSQRGSVMEAQLRYRF